MADVLALISCVICKKTHAINTVLNCPPEKDINQNSFEYVSDDDLENYRNQNSFEDVSDDDLDDSDDERGDLFCFIYQWQRQIQPLSSGGHAPALYHYQKNNCRKGNQKKYHRKGYEYRKQFTKGTGGYRGYGGTKGYESHFPSQENRTRSYRKQFQEDLKNIQNGMW